MLFYIHLTTFEARTDDRFIIKQRKENRCNLLYEDREQFEAEMKMCLFTRAEYINLMINRNFYLKLNFLFHCQKVSIRLENSIWIFGGMAGSMFRGSIPGKHLHTIFKSFLRTSLAFHLHG